MQVFKTYFKILKKQIAPISIYAVIFLSMAIAITSNIKVDNGSYKTKKVKIMVINDDEPSELVEGFLEYMENYAIFVEPEEDIEARMDALFFQKVVYILTIPKGFSESFIKDGSLTLSKQSIPDATEIISVDNAINNYFNMAKVYIKHMPLIEPQDLRSLIKKNLEEEAKVVMNVETADDVTYSNYFNSNFFNYLAYILIASLVNGVSMVMLSFHGLDIRRRHVASPLKYKNMNIQLLIGNLIFSFGYLILFIISGYVLNDKRMINANALYVWLNAAVFLLTALSISYLIGITVSNRKAVSAASTAVSLSLAFISGVFVPQEYLGAAVLKVASFTPTFWYVKANNAIAAMSSIGASEIKEILGYFAIQLGFAAAIISVALAVSKRQRQLSY